MTQVELTDQELKAIDILTRTGLFGKTRADVMERLISRSIEDLMADGILDIDDFAKPEWKS